jgi:hypothetical protein
MKCKNIQVQKKIIYQRVRFFFRNIFFSDSTLNLLVCLYEIEGELITTFACVSMYTFFLLKLFCFYLYHKYCLLLVGYIQSVILKEDFLWKDLTEVWENSSFCMFLIIHWIGLLNNAKLMLSVNWQTEEHVGYSSFFHQYSWNIVESGVKHHDSMIILESEQ